MINLTRLIRGALLIAVISISAVSTSSYAQAGDLLVSTGEVSIQGGGDQLISDMLAGEEKKSCKCYKFSGGQRSYGRMMTTTKSKCSNRNFTCCRWGGDLVRGSASVCNQT